MGFVGLFYTAEGPCALFSLGCFETVQWRKPGLWELALPREGWNGTGFSRTTPAFSGNASVSRGDHAFSTKNKAWWNQTEYGEGLFLFQSSPWSLCRYEEQLPGSNFVSRVDFNSVFQTGPCAPSQPCVPLSRHFSPRARELSTCF